MTYYVSIGTLKINQSRNRSIDLLIDWKSIATKRLSVGCMRFAAALSCTPCLRVRSAIVRMLRWADVIYWRRCWRRRRRRCSQQLVIVGRAVDGVVDDGQLLSADKSFVARVAREAVYVKHELFDAHHQLRRRDRNVAFGTTRHRVPPADIKRGP